MKVILLYPLVLTLVLITPPLVEAEALPILLLS
jgi:hypothetical protein